MDNETENRAAVFLFSLEFTCVSYSSTLQENGLFLSFPYVCPEPVLVERSFLCINGSKRPFFLPDCIIQLVDRIDATGLHALWDPGRLSYTLCAKEIRRLPFCLCPKPVLANTPINL